MQNRYFSLLTFVSLFLLSWNTGWSAEEGKFSGRVSSGDESLTGAAVSIPALNKGATADQNGNFLIDDLQSGKYLVRVSFIGYISKTDTIVITGGKSLERNYTLQEDMLNLEEVVITGTRSEIERYNSPVIINTISNRTFDVTQSLSLAEGLKFSPGLRVENNCQNCGFTQVRMNGLDGPYSQILINSRPVFSAMAGVYGLEMIPANMIDRIEVMRGGGSVMFGGNAIAGTVNIITKDPFENTFEVGFNQALINGEASDRTVNLNGSVVSNKLDKGFSFFAFNRDTEPWDANGDGFSELVKLNNKTFGLDAFWNLHERSKLKLGAYYINEFRRGGNKFELAPHQTDITEQVQHDIVSTNISYELFSKDYKHKFALYGSFQNVNRSSYYGGGGRIIQPGDSLTEEDHIALNAYGTSHDLSAVGGFQYNYEISERFLLTAGSEYISNNVSDRMPGYGRSIDQNVGTLGTYAQLEIRPTEKLTFLIGGRYDHLKIDGKYGLEGEEVEDGTSLNVVVPRLSAMYKLTDDLKVRASYAQGYRGPQAFDEDLHIEVVGGAARFVVLDSNLVTEKSNSVLLSFNYDKVIGKTQMNFVVEGFYTHLLNPFIYTDPVELPSGVSVITKRNGAGATVSGVNLEANIALGSKLVFQSGATLQTAVYSQEEVIWAPEDDSDPTPATVTDRLLRTPDLYGYFSLVYMPTDVFTISYSGVLTGPMQVPHLIDPETERTIIETSQTFFEHNIKFEYEIPFEGRFCIDLLAGVQNITNSYQTDFDSGADRDPGYVYGPLRPRTFYLGLKFGIH